MLPVPCLCSTDYNEEYYLFLHLYVKFVPSEIIKIVYEPINNIYSFFCEGKSSHITKQVTLVKSVTFSKMTVNYSRKQIFMC